MKIRNLKIGVRLGLGYGLLVLMTAIVGFIEIRQVESLWDNTEKMYRHPLVVSNAVRDIRANIIAMHRSMKDVALAMNDRQIDLAEIKVNENEKEIYNLFKIVFERFLGDKSDVETAHNAFVNWKVIRDEVIQLVHDGEIEKAAEITKDKGAEHVAFMNEKIQTMIDFANDKAVSFYEDAEKTKQRVTNTLMLILSCITAMSIMIAFIITRGITNPIGEMTEVSRKIEKGDYSARNKFVTTDETGFLAQTINNMAASIQSHHAHLEEAVENRTTELTKSNEQLRQYEHIVSSSTDLIALVDKRFIYLAVNTTYLEAFGLTASQVIGYTVSDVFGEEFFKTVIKPNALRCLAGEEIKYQAWFDFPANEPRYLDVTYNPYTDVNKEVMGFVVNARNITERKHAEETQRESEERFRITAEETGQLLYAFDPKTGKVKWAGAIEAVTGYTYEEYQSFDVDNWAEQIHPDDREMVLKAMDEAVESHTRFDAEYRFRRKDGSYIFVEEHGAFVPASESALYPTLGTINDITERKQAEEQIKNQNILLEKAVQEKQHEMELLMERLVRQEKLAAIGQISGSIAHELRNPLGAIKQSIFYLNRLHKNDKLASSNSKVQEHLKLLFTEIDASDRVISDLLQMTKVEPLKKEQTNLRTIILEAVDRSHIKDRIQIKIELNPEPFLMWIDPLQMRQVFINIISNALQSISKKGVITINAKMLKKDQGFLVEIQDNGCGIASKDLGKVFEPLFTTKAKGTGLGLSICKQTIENHGGSITLSSQVEKGTTVNMQLPIKNISENINEDK